MQTVNRKSIDLDDEVVAALKLGAATNDMSVKRYMEFILCREAEKLKELKVADLLKTKNQDPDR